MYVFFCHRVCKIADCHCWRDWLLPLSLCQEPLLGSQIPRTGFLCEQIQIEPHLQYKGLQLFVQRCMQQASNLEPIQLSHQHPTLKRNIMEDDVLQNWDGQGNIRDEYLYSFRHKSSNPSRCSKLDKIFNILRILLTIRTKNTSVWVRVYGMMNSTLISKVNSKWTRDRVISITRFFTL